MESLTMNILDSPSFVLYAVSLEDIKEPLHFLHLKPVAQASCLQSGDAGETPALLLVAVQEPR
jgi:hypothetical protein